MKRKHVRVHASAMLHIVIVDMLIDSTHKFISHCRLKKKNRDFGSDNVYTPHLEILQNKHI